MYVCTCLAGAGSTLPITQPLRSGPKMPVNSLCSSVAKSTYIYIYVYVQWRHFRIVAAWEALLVAPLARGRLGGRETGRGRCLATCRGRGCGNTDRDVALVAAKQDDNALECASKDRPKAEQHWDQAVKHQQAGAPATAARSTNSQDYHVRRPRAGDQKHLQSGATADVMEAVNLFSLGSANVRLVGRL